MEAVLALLSLLGLVMADLWLSEVTLEVGIEAGLIAATVARGPLLDRGLTVLAVVDERMVAELTEEASASGFVPPGISVALVVDTERGFVVVVLGLGALGRGAAAGLVVLVAGVVVVLGASLDPTGRAGGTGGLVEVLNVLVAGGAPVVAGADLGLEPEYELCYTGHNSSPNTPDLNTFLTPSIFCPIFPSLPKVLLLLFSLSLTLPLMLVSMLLLTTSFEGE